MLITPTCSAARNASRSDRVMASDADLASTAEGLRQVLGRLDLLGGPPYNLVLHTAPVTGQVDDLLAEVRQVAGGGRPDAGQQMP